MDRVLFCLMVITTLFLVSDCAPLTDIRNKILSQRVNTTDNLLSGIQAGRFKCNATMYTESGKVDEVSKLVQHLCKGPLLAKMDLSRGYSNKKKILLKLPGAMEVCMKSYEGTPVSPEQAQITCLQDILWRYEAPTKARDLRRARTVAKRYSANIFKIRPLPPRGLRREYRILSQNERKDFQKGMNELFQAKVQCDKFLDPNCNNLRANLSEETNENLQPSDEFQTIEQMMPINLGELFQVADEDSRSLLTMKKDMEGFEKKKFPKFRTPPTG